MDLIRHFPAEVLANALADWSWLPELDGMTPLVTSAFGDVFLESSDGIWFLDTIEGTVTREWDHSADLQDSLNSIEGQDRYLLLGLVQATADAGMTPAADEVLSFKLAPIQGGAFELANLELSDLTVALSTTGQLHRRLKESPAGADVAASGVEAD